MPEGGIRKMYIDTLVEFYDQERGPASSAVERAIGIGDLPDDFDEAVVQIYTEKKYWE